MTLTTKRERKGRGALSHVEWSTSIDAPMTSVDIRKFMRSVNKRLTTRDLGSVLAACKKDAIRILKTEKAGSSIANEAQGVLNCCKSISCHVANGDAEQAVYAAIRLGIHGTRGLVFEEKKSALTKKHAPTRDAKKRAIAIFKDYRKVKPRDRTGEVVNAVRIGLKLEGHELSEKTLRGLLGPLMPKVLRKAGRPPKD